MRFTSRCGSYTLLVGTMLFTGIFSMSMSSSSLYLILGYVTAFFGGTFPDVDLMLSIKIHHHPITHSALIPMAIASLALFICPLSIRSLFLLQVSHWVWFHI
ncbi:MAG: hypothetical protein ACTSWN_09685 [Promethearchaeota archaeon]